MTLSAPRKTEAEEMIMTEICYLNLKQAREVLAGIGVELTPRQIKRAADKDALGMRKLPFFVDPISGTLKIEKGTQKA